MRRISSALLVALLLPAIAAGASKDTKLTLVAYSTPKDAYGQLISAFQKTPAGNGVSFSQSYGASGEQRRAVAAWDWPRLRRRSAAPPLKPLSGSEASAPTRRASS